MPISSLVDSSNKQRGKTRENSIKKIEDKKQLKIKTKKEIKLINGWDSFYLRKSKALGSELVGIN